jgi:hypothetical protein
MRFTINALRNRMSELGCRRVDATSAAFLQNDFFSAYCFLYPALRLSDGRIIPITQILNAPHAPLVLMTDSTADFPTPDTTFIA